MLKGTVYFFIINKIIKDEKHKYFSFFVIFFVSCSNNNSKVSVKTLEPLQTEPEKELSKNKSVCVVPLEDIKNRCFKDTVVVWVYPSQKELDSIENLFTKDEAETFEQDLGIYNTDAQSFLLDVAEKYMISDYVKSYRFVVRHDTLHVKLKKLNKNESLWRIILFDGNKSPVITAPVNLQEDYQKYFRVKL